MREKEVISLIMLKQKIHEFVDNVLHKTEKVLSEGKRLKDGLTNLWSTFTKK